MKYCDYLWTVYVPSRQNLKMSLKARDEYGRVMHLVKENEKERANITSKPTEMDDDGLENDMQVDTSIPVPDSTSASTYQPPSQPKQQQQSQALVLAGSQQQALVPKKPPSMPKPNWHPPWKLCRVRIV